MALLGQAALAMWWDIAPEVMPEFAHWHAHEHFPERLSIPGFHRASRWTACNGGDGIFVMYELRDHEVLASPSYLERLNTPSDWSVRMMPLHLRMVRSQCFVQASRGGLTARFALTVRLSPEAGRGAGLLEELNRLADRLVTTAGCTGFHVLRHEAPAISVTEEQRIRGLKDRYADWIVVLTGYDAAAVRAMSTGSLADECLIGWGARATIERAVYTLAFSATPDDMIDVDPATAGASAK
ncbi:MAG: hypothetical protein EOO22_01620 [Comamonadaceae bacterium]|nr:MAG: hypothetical protein EOO22_01620 [Comamonadaceae bacterium]